MNKLKKNNKGISLVEVIVSMAILAIIAVPLLSYFSSAAAYNARAKNRQTAVTLAQSIVEKCKDTNIEEIAKGFHVTSASSFASDFHLVNPIKVINSVDSSRPEDMVWELKSDGTAYVKGSEGSFAGGKFTTAHSTDGNLYYIIRNIQEGGYSYDASITFNTNQKSGDTYQGINMDNLYNINAVNAPNNLVAVETTQNTLGIYAMKSLNAEHCDSINSSNAGTPGWVNKVPVDDAIIEQAIARDIYIDMDYISDEYVKVKIFYKYYCPGVEGCPDNSTSAIEVDPPLFSENVKISDMKNIYLFFQKINNPSGNPVKVILDIDILAQSKIMQKMNLYLVCQAINMLTDTAPDYDLNIMQINNSYTAKMENLYTNARSSTLDGISFSPNNYITSSSLLRMMNVTVEIYRAGELNNPDFLFATLSSTKDE